MLYRVIIQNANKLMVFLVVCVPRKKATEEQSFLIKPQKYVFP